MVSRRKTTEGYANQLIDAAIHPLTRGHPEMWVLDGLLHAAVEGDLGKSIQKNLRYNLEPLLKEIEESWVKDQDVVKLKRLIEQKTGVNLYSFLGDILYKLTTQVFNNQGATK